MSQLVAGAGEEMEQGGLGQAFEPTMEERLQQAYDQIVQMHTQQEQLRKELDKMKKGKAPDRGRPPLPPNP